MPHWQEELDALLANLRVSLDDPLAADDGASTFAPASVQGVDAAEIARDLALPADGDEPPGENEEVSAIRSEIEATLGRVLALARAGRMDGDMRDDVIFVLQALTRPHPGATVAASGADTAEARDEWQLGSAAAVLRFCRMVVRLTNALAADAEG
ncbi:MAG TPA: hypothetical protein VJQ45_03910 [Ktedonobacterales bacterium]|nr:hypothetical protein [Ktedonobacterales bacterium]